MMNNVSRKDLKIVSRNFRSISSRLLTCAFEDFNANIKRLYNYIENEPIIIEYIKSCIDEEYNIEEEIKEVSQGYGRVIFNQYLSEKEEVSFTYQLLKFISEKNIDYLKYTRGYTHSNKFQDMTKGFAERVVLPFVNDIDSYLERIFTEMGFDENETYTIINNGGQVNISKGNSLINATQNNYNKVDKLVKKIKEEINDSIEDDLKEIIIDNIEGIQEEIKKPNMKKGRIKSFIDSLKNKALPKLGTAIQLTASITEIITFAQNMIT